MKGVEWNQGESIRVKNVISPCLFLYAQRQLEKKKKRAWRLLSIYLPRVFSVLDASYIALLKVLHKEAHSTSRELPGGTNGYNLGCSTAILFPLWTNFASGRSMGGRLSDNPSFSWRSNKKLYFSSLSTPIPILSSLTDMAIGRSRSWWARFRGHIARRSSTVHRWNNKKKTS